VKSSAECKQWHITDAQAKEFLQADTERFANEINNYFTRSFTQNQFDALVSFSYNVGYAFEKYAWPKDAPDSYFPGVMIQYTNPAKFREGLTRRRKAEIEVFNNPVDIESTGQTGGSVNSGMAADPEYPEYQTTWTVPTVLYTPPAVKPTYQPVTTFPPIPPLFSGGFGAR
jgi:hypothetical protein